MLTGEFALGGAVTERADRWIRRTTIGCVGLLALIAGTVSYLHMQLLVELHGQPGWVAALTPLPVDGMIIAASTTLLAESRSGRRGGLLPSVPLVQAAWPAWPPMWQWLNLRLRTGDRGVAIVCADRLV